MAGRIQALANVVVDEYGGMPAIWSDAPTGAELLARLRALLVRGESEIFLALLAKQLGVAPKGLDEGRRRLREEGVPVGGRRRRRRFLQQVRDFKKAAKAAAKAQG